MGWFLRGLGQTASDVETARQGNSAIARQQTLDRAAAAKANLDNLLTQARIKSLGAAPPSIDKDKIRAQLVSYASDLNESPRNRKNYLDLVKSLDSGVPVETIAQTMLKLRQEQPEKPEDVTKQYSNALARGDMTEAARLLPLVKQFMDLTKPRTSYNVHEALHEEHPDWTPEQILAAGQPPSFPRIAQVNDAKGNVIGYNYFQGMPGGNVNMKFLNAGAGGAPLPGGVIPPKPTGTTLTMAQMASTVLPEMKRVSDEVDTVASQLGPAVGRWNEFMTGKLGAANPQMAHLQTDLKLLSSAIVRTHFGGRGGQEYIDGLEQYFRLAQSPENLKARISAANEWLDTYAGMAGGTTTTQSKPESTSSAPPAGAKVRDYTQLGSQ